MLRTKENFQYNYNLFIRGGDCIHNRLRLLEIIVIIELEPIGYHKVLRVPVKLFDPIELARRKVVVGLMAFEAKFIVIIPGSLIVRSALVLENAQNLSAFCTVFLFVDIKTEVAEEVVFVTPILLKIGLLISRIRRVFVSRH